MDSILNYVKKNIGLSTDDSHFDPDIISDINNVLSYLTQLGIGPESGFEISDSFAKWSDFLPSEPKWNCVKTYVHLKVKLIFDPPSSSSLLEAINREIKELEWRITNMV